MAKRSSRTSKDQGLLPSLPYKGVANRAVPALIAHLFRDEGPVTICTVVRSPQRELTIHPHPKKPGRSVLLFSGWPRGRPPKVDHDLGNQEYVSTLYDLRQLRAKLKDYRSEASWPPRWTVALSEVEVARRLERAGLSATFRDDRNDPEALKLLAASLVKHEHPKAPSKHVIVKDAKTSFTRRRARR